MPAPSSSSASLTVAAPSGLAPLVVSGLSVTYPDRTVLSGIDLLAQPGRRIGLVGENGVGKSTLLRAVAGRLPARARVAGTVTTPDDLVLLGQEPPFRDTATVAEVLAMTLAPLRTAVRGAHAGLGREWQARTHESPHARVIRQICVRALDRPRECVVVDRGTCIYPAANGTGAQLIGA